MVRRTHNQPNHRSHLRPFNSTIEMLGFLYFHSNQAPCYKLYALAPPAVAAPPSKPGVVRVAAGGAAIVLETYDIPLVSVGAFMKKVDSQRRYTLSNLTVGTLIHSLCACCHQVCPEGVCRFATRFAGWKHETLLRQGLCKGAFQISWCRMWPVRTACCEYAANAFCKDAPVLHLSPTGGRSSALPVLRGLDSGTWGPRHVPQVPPPLAIGSILLEDGSTVKGFMAEPYVIEAGEGVEDITHLASWVAYQQGIAAS